MRESSMADRFEDHRGVIQDLLGEVDAVTEIRSNKGAIRGNHVHYHTTQWTYIVSGRLRIVTRDPGGVVRERVYGPEEIACEEPGVSHAWEAVDDVVCLVFSRGPRSGENYESDTIRLSGDDLLL
jgi:quercetin dioxygenase-like cupin family protein